MFTKGLRLLLVVFLALVATVTSSPVHNSTAGASLVERANGYKNVVYYADWDIYGRNFRPQQLPAGEITHALFSFASPNNEGTVLLKDKWADLGSDVDTIDAFGVIGELYRMKKRNRNLKTVFSIGGWSDRDQFPHFALEEWKRKEFARSAVELMTNFGMDGIDIDWEYPNNDAEGWAMKELAREVREALDRYSREYAGGYHFYLSFATSAGFNNYQYINFAEMNQFIDSWHLMAYDFTGPWTKTGHHANLYKSISNPDSTPLSIDETVSDYFARGIPADKIVLGLPAYGHVFSNTYGAGTDHGETPFDPAVMWEAGSIDYKKLPLPGAYADVDYEAVAAYTYNPDIREWVTYDNPCTVQRKAEYLKNRGLGGAMWWEGSGDRAGEGSLIDTMSNALGYQFEWQENLLSYPASTYNNIRETV